MAPADKSKPYNPHVQGAPIRKNRSPSFEHLPVFEDTLKQATMNAPPTIEREGEAVIEDDKGDQEETAPNLVPAGGAHVTSDEHGNTSHPTSEPASSDPASSDYNTADDLEVEAIANLFQNPHNLGIETVLQGIRVVNSTCYRLQDRVNTLRNMAAGRDVTIREQKQQISEMEKEKAQDKEEIKRLKERLEKSRNREMEKKGVEDAEEIKRLQGSLKRSMDLGLHFARGAQGMGDQFEQLIMEHTKEEVMLLAENQSGEKLE